MRNDAREELEDDVTEINREDLVAAIGFDPLADRQRREDHAVGIRRGLAEAWLWVRNAASDDEAGEMVVECLKKIREPWVTLEDVIREAKLHLK